MNLMQEPLPATEWPAIIAAFFVGLGTLVTAVVAGAVLVLQVVNKRDTDTKLDKIDVNVNGNLTKVHAELAQALEILQLLRPPTEPDPIEAATLHRAVHRRLQSE